MVPPDFNRCLPPSACQCMLDHVIQGLCQYQRTVFVSSSDSSSGVSHASVWAIPSRTASSTPRSEIENKGSGGRLPMACFPDGLAHSCSSFSAASTVAKTPKTESIPVSRNTLSTAGVSPASTNRLLGLRIFIEATIAPRPLEPMNTTWQYEPPGSWQYEYHDYLCKKM